MEPIRSAQTQAEAALEAHQAAHDTLQAELNTTLTAFLEAQVSLARMEADIKDRSMASETATERASSELVDRTRECEDLTKKLVDIEEDRAKTNLERQRIEEELKTLEEVSGKREDHLQQSLRSQSHQLQAVESELKIKTQQVDHLTASLERAQSVVASAITPTLKTASSPSSTPLPPSPLTPQDGYAPTPEELAGIQRLQDAVIRLRGERNALIEERTQLQLSLVFSVSQCLRSGLLDLKSLA